MKNFVQKQAEKVHKGTLFEISVLMVFLEFESVQKIFEIRTIEIVKIIDHVLYCIHTSISFLFDD